MKVILFIMFNSCNNTQLHSLSLFPSLPLSVSPLFPSPLALPCPSSSPPCLNIAREYFKTHCVLVKRAR